MNRHLFFVLTYAPGTEPDPAHMRDFVRVWRQWCIDHGFNPSYLWQSVKSTSGRQWYRFGTSVPRGIRIPHLDQSGMWPHGLAQVVSRCERAQW